MINAIVFFAECRDEALFFLMDCFLLRSLIFGDFWSRHTGRLYF
jgi:hypothetical protein